MPVADGGTPVNVYPRNVKENVQPFWLGSAEMLMYCVSATYGCTTALVDTYCT
jgi:hypothetical protein